MSKRDLHNKWMELRASGLSYDKISARLGVSKQTQIKWTRKYAQELERMKAEEHSAMIERLALTKKMRLAAMSALLDDIELELSKRDVAELPTPALIRLKLQTLSQVRSEVDPLEVHATVDSSMTRWFEIVSKCVKSDVREVELPGGLVVDIQK